MSAQQTRIERCGNIRVHQTSPHQPAIRPVAEVIAVMPAKDFGSSWHTEIPIAA